MLKEILDTRVMIKQAMKKYKDNKVFMKSFYTENGSKFGRKSMFALFNKQGI